MRVWLIPVLHNMFPLCSQGTTLGQCWNVQVPRHGLVTQVVVRRRYGGGRRFRWSGVVSDVRVVRICLP